MSAASFRLLPRAVDRGGVWIADRLARVFIALRFTPNAITLLALAAACGAGFFLGHGRPFAAGLLIVASGFLDMLDGNVARLSGRTTRFGALLDSSLDRCAEFALYGGLGYYFRGRFSEGLAALAFLGSVMVSYTRARAEALGLECKVGIMSRPERIILIAVGLFFHRLLPYAVYILVALTAVTVMQRMIHTYRQLRT